MFMWFCMVSLRLPAAFVTCFVAFVSFIAIFTLCAAAVFKFVSLRFYARAGFQQEAKQCFN